MDGSFEITATSIEIPDKRQLKQSYDFLDDTWNGYWFKIHLHESLQGIKPMIGDKIAILKSFDYEVTRWQVAMWAKENDYRFPFPWEREAFAKANPDQQREGWIIDLGSYMVRPDQRIVSPVLHIHEGGRLLGFGDVNDTWEPGDRFLLIHV